MKSLSKGELFFLLLIFLGFSASAGVLYYDAFHSTRTRSGVLVGTITYKNRTAEQKQTGSNLWFEAPQDGPIYNFDTIRTGPGSSAIIELGPQGKIELGEESMVLIRIENHKATIALASGNLQVTNAESATPISLETSSGKISVNSGSVFLQENAGAISLRSIGGTAVIETEEAAPVEVSSVESFNLAERTVRKDTIAIITPAQNTYLVSADDRTPVIFSWTPQTTPVELEISTDRTFTKTVYQSVSATSGTTVPLPAGSYYWQLPAEGASGFFTILKGKAPVLNQSGERSFARTESTVSVPFSWSKAASADLYRLEVYSTTASVNAPPAHSIVTAQRSLLLEFDTDGSWYWTVSALYGPEAIPFSSARATFSISAQKPSPPEITSASKRMITWNPVANDAIYDLRISTTSNTTQSAFEASTKNTWISPGDALSPANLLSTGTWKVEVRALIAGSAGDWSAPKLFTIDETKPVELQSPEASLTIPLSLKKITLMWKDPNEGSKYHLLISANPDFSSPIVDAFPTRTSYALSFTAFTTGIWYWKVSLASDDETPSASQVRSFTLVEKMETPKPVSPVGGAQLELNELENIKLSWKAVPLADSYIVRMYRMTGGVRSLISEWSTQNTEILIDDLSDFALDSFAWELVSVKNNGKESTIESEPILSYFRIVQSEPLALPSIRTMKTKGGY